jgi:hypothetical protein
MDIHITEIKKDKSVTLLARAGLIAKGFVYCTSGLLALMAALHIGNESSKEADSSGVLYFLNDSSVGSWLLPLLALGLLCYSVWRFTEAYQHTKGSNKDWKKAARYILSGLAYVLLALSAIKIVLDKDKKGGDSQQAFAGELLSKPFGQWLLGIAAVIIAGIGIYQVYYGLSEKYRKHVQNMSLHTKHANLMLGAGKIGYVARGIVWLIIGYLMMQAAIASSSSQAGDSGEAFSFIQQSPMGKYLLAALGVGLIGYGCFNFIRARYENFREHN